MGEVDVGAVEVGPVDVGPVVVGDVGLVLVGVVVVGPVVAGEVGVGVVGAPTDVGVDGRRGVVSLECCVPPPTRLLSVVSAPEPDPVSSDADLPIAASKPVRIPKPSARVATQLTKTVDQLIGRLSGAAAAALNSSVSGPSTGSRSARDRGASTGIVSLIAY